MSPHEQDRETCGELADRGGFFRCQKPAGHSGDRHHVDFGVGSYTWGYVPTTTEGDPVTQPAAHSTFTFTCQACGKTVQVTDGDAEAHRCPSAPARCVLSLINQGLPDEGVACMVHTTYAPCPHDKEPANPDPIHGDDRLGRDSAIGIWAHRTARQRPLLIHHGDLASGRHVLAADCWCKPEEVRS